jgi:hypothetical protein
MNVLGLVFGFAVARGLPDASRIALVGGLPRSPIFGLVLASTLANRERSNAPVVVRNTEDTQTGPIQKKVQSAGG